MHDISDCMINFRVFQFVLAEVRGCGFRVTLHAEQLVSELRRLHNIYAFETEPPQHYYDVTAATDCDSQSSGSTVSGQVISVIVLNMDIKYARR